MQAILCFGDSITFGKGDIAKRGWCGRLQASFENDADNRFVYNLGIPGDTTIGLLERLEIEACARARTKYDDDRSCTLIAIGTNDARLNGGVPETPIEAFSKNIDAILTIAKRYASVGVIGLTPVDESLTHDYEGTSFTNERIRAYNEALRKIARTHDVPFLDLLDPFLQEPYRTMLEDGLHPNKKGYEWMYAQIVPFLIENELIGPDELRVS
jgi:acyl-CoA thioesterase I